MLFNSYIFIFLFLPLCLAGFYILEKRQATLAKVWLTCFSFWFYGYFNPAYLIIMLGSIIGNYFIHCMLVWSRNKKEKDGKKKREKNILITGVTANLLLLFYFKYFDFFIENINVLFGKSISFKEILLPLGISFFTFQQISFLTDTYRRELETYGRGASFADTALKSVSKDVQAIKPVSFVDYALFVSFFPQLIAGPIVVHEEMMPQFARIGKDDRSKEERWEIFSKGIYVFVLGLAKKVLIADTFGSAVDFAYSNVNSINGLESLLTIIFYSLQLYFDFSGYCDMAKGLAGMFGMSIANNFNSPYKAVNIVEFWKRWHITLSRFFTKNIYIPLGGNRKGAGRMYGNFLLIFFLSGLWHGAGWNYILWGMMHGVLYVITKWWMRQKETRVIEKPDGLKMPSKKEWKKKRKIAAAMGKAACCILTFIFVSIAWVYFRADSIQQANTLLLNVIRLPWALPGSGFTDVFNLGEFWYILKVLKITNLPYAQYYIMILFLSIVLIMTFFGKNVDALAAGFKPTVIQGVFTSLLFIWCVVSLSGVSTFLYFNF